MQLVDKADDSSDHNDENERRSNKRRVMAEAAMKVEDRGIAECEIAVQARGQPKFKGGKGAKELQKMVRQLWWERREQEVRRKIGRGVGGGEGKQRTLYKRKEVKVVPVVRGVLFADV